MSHPEGFRHCFGGDADLTGLEVVDVAVVFDFEAHPLLQIVAPERGELAVSI